MKTNIWMAKVRVGFCVFKKLKDFCEQSNALKIFNVSLIGRGNLQNLQLRKYFINNWYLFHI